MRQLHQSESFASTLLVNNPQFAKGSSGGDHTGARASDPVSKNPSQAVVEEQQVASELLDDSTDAFQKAGRAQSLPQGLLRVSGPGPVLTLKAAAAANAAQEPHTADSLIQIDRLKSDSTDSQPYQTLVTQHHGPANIAAGIDRRLPALKESATPGDRPLLEPLVEEEPSQERQSSQVSRANVLHEYKAGEQGADDQLYSASRRGSRNETSNDHDSQGVEAAHL